MLVYWTCKHFHHFFVHFRSKYMGVDFWIDKSVEYEILVVFTACYGFTIISSLTSDAARKFFISKNNGSSTFFLGISVPLSVLICISCEIKSEVIIASPQTALNFLTLVGVIQFDAITATRLALKPSIMVAKSSCSCLIFPALANTTSGVPSNNHIAVSMSCTEVS